jgi:hypothetical protein
VTGIPPGLTLPAEILGAAGRYDYVDHFAVESGKEIRHFLADFFSHRPGWLRALFLLRKPLALALGIKHSLQADRAIAPGDVPFEPGESLWVFRVVAAEEGRYWTGAADDVHLFALLAIVSERTGPGNYRHRVMTFVRYKNWRGPFYFFVVRPFHTLVVKAMAEGAR